MSRFSLPALRAFEAVGRLGSFSKAALELGVSQSAISRHIASMEMDLNGRLLRRTTRSCELTAMGENLHREIAQGLKQIDDALIRAKQQKNRDVIHVSVSPFLSGSWFTPRLLEFMQKNPDLEIKLIHSYHPPDFDSGDIDVGLNWQQRPQVPRVAAEIILSGRLTPACSPGYASDHIDCSDPASLVRCQLFHEFRIEDWATWFHAQGVSQVSPESQQISDTGALRKAAISGKGVCLLFEVLIEDDVADGRLFRPFGTSVSCGEDYWMTYPVEHRERPAVRRFIRWLRNEAKVDSAA